MQAKHHAAAQYNSGSSASITTHALCRPPSADSRAHKIRNPPLTGWAIFGRWLTPAPLSHVAIIRLVHHSAGIPHNTMLSSCGNATTSDPSRPELAGSRGVGRAGLQAGVSNATKAGL